MKGFSVPHNATIWTYDEPISMSNSFNGLSRIVSKKFRQKVTDGDIFLFINKARTYIKVLYWQYDGFCIFSKKVPNGMFDAEDLGAKLTFLQLEKLINGVIVNGGKKLPRLRAAA